MAIQITQTHGTRLAALASECIIGEALPITITLLNADGSARDCTGGTVAFSWERPGGSGPTLTITAAGEATGIHSLSLSDATTQLLDAKYSWDAWFSPAVGAREQLIAQSSLLMLPSIGPSGVAEAYSQLATLIEAAQAGAPRVFATCAAARAGADPVESPTIYVTDRGTFTWTTDAGSDSGTELTQYIAGTGGGFAFDSVSYLDFANAGTPVARDGRVYWDGSTLCVMTPGGVTVNVGREMHDDCWNATGAPIADGSVVYASGGHSNQVEITKFVNGTSDTGDRVIGVTTQDIASSDSGLVTTLGLVHGLNTSGLPDGTIVYTSGVAGQLSATMPAGTVDGARVGIIVNESPSQGTILVHPAHLPRLAGTTAARPTTPRTGAMYFDTTLGYPVWWDGSAWVDGYPDTWDDVIGPIDFAASVAALTQETYRDTPAMVSKMRHDQNDALTLRFQMPHGWDLGNVSPHIHFIPTAAGSGTFALDGYYAWSRIGTLALPALSGWTPFTASKALVAGDQWIEQVLSLATVVSPANAKYPSANLWVYLRRVSATDTYETSAPDGTAQANIVLAGADCHVRRSRAGTDGEWS